MQTRKLSLSSWKPNPDRWVEAIAVVEDTVYVAGAFGFVVVGTDGTVRKWGTSSHTIKALAARDDLVYAGGYFDSIGGEERSCLAAFGRDGILKSWNPNVSGVSERREQSCVCCIAVNGDTVYVGGSFDSVGGEKRSCLAAFGADGTLKNWNPRVDAQVNSLAIVGDTVYVGGCFSSVGGEPRNGLAAIGTDGKVKRWNPTVDGRYIGAIAASREKVYVGGNFTSICGEERSYLAAFSTDGTLTSWAPDPNSFVEAIVVHGDAVYVGGRFSSIGGEKRSRFAVFGLDGTLESPAPRVELWEDDYERRHRRNEDQEKVKAIAVSGNAVFMGGEFTEVEGQTRTYLAAFDA